jgi:hypothetical protein
MIPALLAFSGLLLATSSGPALIQLSGALVLAGAGLLAHKQN